MSADFRVTWTSLFEKFYELANLVKLETNSNVFYIFWKLEKFSFEVILIFVGKSLGSVYEYSISIMVQIITQIIR